MKDKQFEVRRYLTVYRNDDDLVEAEHDFASFDLQQFQSHFNISSDNPMYDCYPVTENDLKFVTAYLKENLEFNFEKFSYFVEACRQD